jgi:hypothetical protein
MAGFNTRSKTKNVEVELYDRKYSFDVSPNNRDFVKKIVSFQSEVQGIMEVLSKDKGDAMGIVKAYDAVFDKEREVLNFILPGKWDELFAEAGGDLVVMAQLVAYVVTQIASAFAQNKLDEDRAEVPEGATEV